MIRELMAVQKLRGNPKDFVILAGHSAIQDYDRIFTVKASLPPKLDQGNHVWVFNTNGQLVLVLVVHDEGEHVWVSNGKSETKMAREDIYPTGIPRTPTAIHKSKLHLYVGDKHAANFWHKGIGRRVTRPRGA